MLRNQLRHARDFFASLSTLERKAYAILFVIVPFLLISLINWTQTYSWIKIATTTAAIIIALGLLAVVYSSSRKQKNTGFDARNVHHFDESRLPPLPDHPPTVTAEKHHLEIDDEFEIPQESHEEEIGDNPSRYRHSFSLIPVVFKTVIVAVGWIGYLFVSISANSSYLWVSFAIATIVAPLYCYYIALRWNGEEFIVNDEWYERPLTMPAPFTSSTPAIRRSEIGKYFIKQTVLDKIFKTCRLYSDTPSSDDKQFHNVKWLKYPAELRRATGISAPRKNNYLSPFRRRE
jgi:hypothetical protein